MLQANTAQAKSRKNISRDDERMGNNGKMPRAFWIWQWHQERMKERKATIMTTSQHIKCAQNDRMEDTKCSTKKKI